MTVFKGKRRFRLVITALLSILIMGGCTPAIKYSYDTQTNFAQGRNYAWAPSMPIYGRDQLLETNVQVLTDQILAQKGFTKVTGKPDLVISMSYEFNTGMYRDSYDLRMLTLNIYKMEGKMPSASPVGKMSMQEGNTAGNEELVWRGTAFGSICTDAASDSLKKTVEGILSNFPPK